MATGHSSREYMEQYREANRESIRTRTRGWHVKNRHRQRQYNANKTHGVNEATYQIMLLAQDGRCKICCLSPQGRTRCGKLGVDHDHVTGRVRGLLCDKCNLMLGHAGDNSLILQAAIDYLHAGEN